MISKASICLKCHNSFTKRDRVWYGLHHSCFLEWFQLETELEFTSVNRESLAKGDESNKEALWNSSFFQGKFRKYSASLGRSSYILKVKEAQAPELPDVEFICNQIAAMIRLPVPDFYLIDFLGERTTEGILGLLRAALEVRWLPYMITHLH